MLISEKISQAAMFCRPCQRSTRVLTQSSQWFCVSEPDVNSSPGELTGPPLAEFNGLFFQKALPQSGVPSFQSAQTPNTGMT